jgi:hypothetical protein
LAVACGEKEPDETGDSSAEFIALSDAIALQCIGCHGSSGNLSLADEDLVAQTVGVVADGDPTYTRVICGEPENSALYLKLSDPAPFGDPMPSAGTPDQSTIDAIYDWIAAGCPE